MIDPNGLVFGGGPAMLTMVSGALAAPLPPETEASLARIGRESMKGFRDHESFVLYTRMSGSVGYINPDDVQTYTGASVHAFYISQLLFSTIYKWAGNPGSSSTNKNDVGGDGSQKNQKINSKDFKSRYYNGNPDKPVGTMSLSEANKWYYIGNGEGVYIDFEKIILPSTVTVDRFKNPEFEIDGHPGIYVRFDSPRDFVNPNQGLVYGTIGVVLIDEQTVMALPDKYDFDIKNGKGTFMRDLATSFGSFINDFMWMNYHKPQPFPIYFRGYQQIPLK